MGKEKPRGKDKATEKPKSEKSEGSNCFHGKEKQVHQIQDEAGTAGSSSSQSTLTATDVEMSRLFLVAYAVAINPLSVDGARSFGC